MPGTWKSFSARSTRIASRSVADPPIRSMPTMRSSPKASISKQTASRSSSEASTLRERTSSPSSSSTQTQWNALPTSKPIQCIRPASFFVRLFPSPFGFPRRQSPTERLVAYPDQRSGGSCGGPGGHASRALWGRSYVSHARSAGPPRYSTPAAHLKGRAPMVKRRCSRRRCGARLLVPSARNGRRKRSAHGRPRERRIALGTVGSLACSCPPRFAWPRTRGCDDLSASEPGRPCTAHGWPPSCHRG